MGGDHNSICFALDTRKFRRVAVRISVCDDTAAVGICDLVGIFAQACFGRRMDILRRVVRRQYICDVDLPLDEISQRLDYGMADQRRVRPQHS